MKNEIYETNNFKKIFGTFDKTNQNWITKIIIQLESNLEVGKPLKYLWFREKKFGDKRLYYIVDFDKKKAILIAFGNKKDQQKTIDNILINKNKFLEFLKSN